MSEVEATPTGTDPDWWQAIITQAWFDNRSEADRTLVGLSAGGIGLLVTLLTTIQPPPAAVAVLYGAGLIAFLLAVAIGTAIFKLNASFMLELRTNPDGAMSSPRRKTLKSLDWALTIMFGIGVMISVAIGGATAASGHVPDSHFTQEIAHGE
jgi:hypothetical protein